MKIDNTTPPGWFSKSLTWVQWQSDLLEQPILHCRRTHVYLGFPQLLVQGEEQKPSEHIILFGQLWPS